MMNYISKTYGNVGGLVPVGNRNSEKNIEADDKNQRECSQTPQVISK